MAFIAFVLSQVMRLASTTSPVHKPSPEFDREQIQEQLNPFTQAADQKRESFTEEIRSFFLALDRENRLPQDPRSRDALRRWVDSAILELSRSREYYQWRDSSKARELTPLIDRLRTLSVTLSDP